MKIDTKREDAVIMGATTTQFGLNLKDPGVFVQMLMNLYSYPIESSVREYLSNAYDANKESGTDRPVVLGIEDGKFFIQDYGLGISPEFMNNEIPAQTKDGIAYVGYCTIGYSTKKDSDEFIGAYGFGRLTFLSYTNQYWVHTVYEGHSYEYLIFLDGTTIKQTLLKKEPTEEPTGTRVVVQIKQGWDEKNKWIRAIKEQSAYFNGAIISGVFGDPFTVKVESDYEGIVKKTNLDSGNAETHIILGSVFYRIPWDNLPEFNKWNVVKGLRLGIYVGLDENLLPTPSRESFIIDDHSRELLISKFKKICEIYYDTCNDIIKDIPDTSISRLKFRAGNSLNGYTINIYENISRLIGQEPLKIVSDIYRDPSYLYRTIVNLFSVDYSTPIYYSERWTSLKEEYATSLGARGFAKNQSWFNQTPRQLHNWFNLKQTNENQDADYLSLWKELVDEYIDLNFIRVDDAKYEQWKKDRPSKKKTTSQGITYYRSHNYDDSLCTEQKGVVDLSQIPYVFKANKETASQCWNFFRAIQPKLKKYMITKTEGYDLNKLQPSPFLKRICSEALFIQTSRILPKAIYSDQFLKFVEGFNPYLVRLIKEVNFEQINRNIEDINLTFIEGLVETGELLGCFDKNETKLKYIAYHLKKLTLANHFGQSIYQGKTNRYEMHYTSEQLHLIKRVYLLERLNEDRKGQSQPELIDDSQLVLELELN